MEHGNGNNMIRDLRKYTLDFKITYDYISSILKDGNTLSSTLLKKIDFNRGSFFTLLPKEAKISRIYQFSYGGIIPPKDVGYKPQYVKNLQKKFTPLYVQTLREELVHFINSFLSKNKNFVCIFEDVIKTSSDKDLLDEYKIFYENEVYYLIDYFHKTNELISKILHECEEVWHFVSIVTEAKSIVDKKLTVNIIKQMIQNIKLIIIGAYDGEGYLFWEKQ